MPRRYHPVRPMANVAVLGQILLINQTTINYSINTLAIKLCKFLMILRAYEARMEKQQRSDV